MTNMSNEEQDLACCSEDEACEIVLSVLSCEDLPYFGIGVGHRQSVAAHVSLNDLIFSMNF